MKLDGYVIVPPINKWDEINRDKIWLEMSYSLFSKTPTEAWVRYFKIDWRDPDLSIKVQRWHDSGYRLKRATLEIHDD